LNLVGDKTTVNVALAEPFIFDIQGSGLYLNVTITPNDSSQLQLTGPNMDSTNGSITLSWHNDNLNSLGDIPQSFEVQLLSEATVNVANAVTVTKDTILNIYDVYPPQFSVKLLKTTPANICFPAGTLVETDQGEVPIQLITSANTVGGNQVLEVTRTLNQSRKFVVMKKGALGPNKPSRPTQLTPNHAVMYRGRLTKAYKLVCLHGVGMITKPKMDPVYNVLLGKEERGEIVGFKGDMRVNGLVVETLKPEHAERLKSKN
jgi:hypothetical protein